MKASFDGARKNLAHAYNNVAQQLKEGTQNSSEDALKRSMNDLQSAVGGLLCMYDPSCEDDCNDLSNISLIEL